MLKQGACELGGEFGVPINPKFEAALKEKKVTDPVLGKISVYDLVMIRLEQMSEETVLFDPFTGPIKDQEGRIRIEAGRRGTHDELWTMDWFVEKNFPLLIFLLSQVSPFPPLNCNFNGITYVRSRIPCCSTN